MRSKTDPGADAPIAELGAIGKLDRTAVAKRWTALTDAPPPKRSTAKLLSLALAYELQLRSSPELQAPERAIAKLMARPKKNGDCTPARSRTVRKLSVGARLLREWRGRTLTIDVVDGGYLFEGVIYRSLSAIARQATGVARNGPAFFGLRQGEAL